jgi:hypothetical protein
MLPVNSKKAGAISCFWYRFYGPKYAGKLVEESAAGWISTVDSPCRTGVCRSLLYMAGRTAAASRFIPLRILIFAELVLRTQLFSWFVDKTLVFCVFYSSLNASRAVAFLHGQISLTALTLKPVSFTSFRVWTCGAFLLRNYRSFPSTALPSPLGPGLPQKRPSFLFVFSSSPLSSYC